MNDSTDSTARRLGIPASAKHVLVFTESSHWDTNWLKTSEEYFETRIEHIFAHVLRELEKDPRRIYCIESIFFHSSRASTFTPCILPCSASFS